VTAVAVVVTAAVAPVTAAAVLLLLGDQCIATVHTLQHYIELHVRCVLCCMYAGSVLLTRMHAQQQTTNNNLVYLYTTLLLKRC
jgi:hypothetical protein